jgi:hypothetical protein
VENQILLVGDAPNKIAHVISHQQRALRIQRDTDRPTKGIAILAEKSSQHINRRRAGRFTIGERHEDDLIAAVWPVVPRAMLAVLPAVEVGSGLPPSAQTSRSIISFNGLGLWYQYSGMTIITACAAVQRS